MRELNVEPIRSVERAITILNCFSFEKPVQTIDSIMKETKLAKATTYRLLWTLEKNGLIQFDQKTHEYRLGNKHLEYGGIVLHHLDIRKESEPILLDLYEKTGHSVILATPQGNTVQYLLRFHSDEGLQPPNFVGRKRILHNGALGIVLLAYMSDSFIEELLLNYPLEKLTPQTLVDHEAFKRVLQDIRQLGYYVDIDGTFVGYTAIAAPIYNEANEVIAAIGISGASFKMEGERQEQLVSLIKDAAVKISRKIGHGMR